MAAGVRIGLLMLAVALLAPAVSVAKSDHHRTAELNALRSRIAGQILDFTHHHGADRRIMSQALGRKLDVYVYLPPDYRPDVAYPLILWLHGALGDERGFLRTAQLDYLDGLIRAGCHPPVVIVCPDGSYTGEDRLTAPHSLYINGCGGRFQDMLTQDVIPFVTSQFSIRPEREAWAVAGVSGGGFGAANLGIKLQDRFGHVASISGGINLRYDTTRGYFGKFDPATYRWAEDFRPRRAVARFVGGLIRFRQRQFMEPVFGCYCNIEAAVLRENPTDLLFRHPPTGQNWLITYGTKDNLNFDSQGDSFVYFARRQGYDVTVFRHQGGRHFPADFAQQTRWTYGWLGKRLLGPDGPYDADDAVPSSHVHSENEAACPTN